MCGIIGYSGNQQAEPILLDALHKLEYRGYDSVGIVCQNANSISSNEIFHVCKKVGKVSDITHMCENIQGNTGMGHCRWATHGAVTWNNAHPHTSSDGKVVLVHNGIIENYLDIKKMLISKGYTFSSDGDSESIANLLAYLLQNETHCTNTTQTNKSKYIVALLALKKWLKGAYALSIMFADCPTDIFAIRCESPLVVGIGDDELFVASDIIPLAGHVNKVVYINNHELAHLSVQNNARIFYHYDCDGSIIDSKIQTIDWNFETVSKQGYNHFTLKEIYEQPHVFARMYSTYVNEQQPTNFNFSNTQQKTLQNCNRIIFVSCGSSYHASLYAKYLFEQYTCIPTTVEYASEFRYRSPVVDTHTFVIALSQSGETADTLAALQFAQHAGASVLGIVNVASSSIARMADLMLCTDCGPEIGVASTKAFTAQMILLYYFVLYVATLRNTLEDSVVATLCEQSKQLPQLTETLLSKEKHIHELGKVYARYQHMLYLGRGVLYPIALEGALKLKELSYIHAEGYAAAEMKHGPIALVDHSMPIVVFLPKHTVLYEKMQNNIAEVKARGGRVFAFVNEDDKNTDLYDDMFEMPHLSENLDAILFSVSLQFFAYYTALSRGYDPDKPRNLAKSVTVE